MFVFLDIGFTMVGGPEIGPTAFLIRELGLPADAKAKLKQWLFTTALTTPEELADRLMVEYRLDPDDTRAVVGEYWERQIHDAYPLPGAAELVTELEQAGVPYGFITNIWTPFLMGFARVFAEVYAQAPMFASCVSGISKPDPALYRQALDSCGVSPGEAVMVGDTYEMDIAPAMRLGMKSVWLLHRPEKEKQDLIALLNRRAPLPDLTLARMAELNVDRLANLWETR
ncbi:MAG: HAD family hydrolase [Magnetococcales bacterium]|nr:HAD family hydrolase [Magnetococcales bacterium]